MVLKETFETFYGGIACVISESIPGNLDYTRTD